MGREKKKLGKLGEDYAVEYLKGKTRFRRRACQSAFGTQAGGSGGQGYKILGRNVYVGGGEIDIVAKKGNLVVFVEVKTRRSDAYVDVLDSIDETKEEALVTSCEEYLAQNKLGSCNYRIDLIGIVIKNGIVEKFEHIEGFL